MAEAAPLAWYKSRFVYTVCWHPDPNATPRPLFYRKVHRGDLDDIEWEDGLPYVYRIVESADGPCPDCTQKIEEEEAEFKAAYSDKNHILLQKINDCLTKLGGGRALLRSHWKFECRKARENEREHTLPLELFLKRSRILFKIGKGIAERLKDPEKVPRLSLETTIELVADGLTFQSPNELQRFDTKLPEVVQDMVRVLIGTRLSREKGDLEQGLASVMGESI